VSPYLYYFVACLRAAGHKPLVVIPHQPVSWIGKAHAVGKTLTSKSWCPELLTGRDCKLPSCADSEDLSHHWLVIDGPPASCTQIGLHHLGFEPTNFDAVISGPNHGRNASSIYHLSSGTVGGALEAAQCRRKAIAVSFGSKDPQPRETIEAACRRATTLVENLTANWHPNVEIYNINIPMLPNTATIPWQFSSPSRTYWAKGSLFSEVVGSPGQAASGDPKLPLSRTREFRWHTELSDIRQQAECSTEGEDLWASVNAVISVTPFKASLELADIDDIILSGC
jgi:5'/3'-nucleotidase SurE